MNEPARTPILIGERVIIVRPSRHVGKVGRVIDYRDVGRGYLVEFSAVDSIWIEAECVRRGGDPVPELQREQFTNDRSYALATGQHVNHRCDVEPIFDDVHAEPGYDAHLDAIEAAALQRIRERATYDTARQLGQLKVYGTGTLTSRVAFVPKGGA